MSALRLVPRRGAAQRGVSLIEALVAMGVMAFGMLGVVGMQATLRTNADVAKQRAEAVRIAQAAVEDWRAFETLVPAAGCGVSPAPPAFDCIADVAATAVTGYTTNTSYTYTAAVQPPVLAASAPRLKTFAVNVAWADRNGQAQSVGLVSSVAGIAPEVSGSLGLPNDRAPVQRPRGMHPGLPPGTVDQGNGTSTFTPPAAGAPTYVFANLSGVITSVCNPFPSTCVAMTALPLSGFIRFATGTTMPTGADAETPPSPPFAVGVDIVSLTMPVSPAIPPVCYTHLAVGYVSYFCAVPTTTTPIYQWTGRSELVGVPTAAALPTSPAGTALTDATPTNYKVCRYTPVAGCHPIVGNPVWGAAGTTASCSGAAPTPSRPMTNGDHPLDYDGVAVPLANQNFLVIRAGDGTTPFQCPPDLTGTPIHGNTWYHQPSG